MVQFIRVSSFMKNVVYISFVQKWLFRYSRANWPTTVSLTFQLLKVQPKWR